MVKASKVFNTITHQLGNFCGLRLRYSSFLSSIAVMVALLPVSVQAQTYTVSVTAESDRATEFRSFPRAGDNAEDHAIIFKITVTGPALRGNLVLPYTLGGDIEFGNSTSNSPDNHRDVFVFPNTALLASRLPPKYSGRQKLPTTQQVGGGGAEVTQTGTVTITRADHDGTQATSDYYLTFLAQSLSYRLNEADERLTLTLGTPSPAAGGDTVSVTTAFAEGTITDASEDSCQVHWTISSLGIIRAPRFRTYANEGTTVGEAQLINSSGGCRSEDNVYIAVEVDYPPVSEAVRPQNHHGGEPANDDDNPDFRLNLPFGRDLSDEVKDRFGTPGDAVREELERLQILTIPAGATSAALPLAILDDGIAEGEEIVRVTARGRGNALETVLKGPRAGAIRFSDSLLEDVRNRANLGSFVFIRPSTAATRYTLSGGSTSVTEGNVPMDYTVTINRDLDANATVTWSVSGAGSSPARSADFTCDRLPSGSVVFPANAAGSTLTFTLPEVVVDAVAGEGMERFQVSLSGGDAGGIRALFVDAPHETTITNVSSLPRPDINRDLTVDGQDTLIMYYAYTLRRELGNGQASNGSVALRQRLLGGLGSMESDVGYRTLICNAVSWRQIARPVGGDITGDAVIDGNDALVMYYAYEFSEVVGTGAPGAGYLQLRTLLLNGLAAPMSPADADYRALIRQANRIKNP